MKDNYNIELEDISSFPLERSLDFSFWEEVSYQELQEKVLDNLEIDKARRFCGIIRTGCPFQLNDYFYRIKST
jgi:hypothetical protein